MKQQYRNISKTVTMIAILAFGVTACTTEEPIKQNEVRDVTLTFNHMFGGAELDLENTEYTTPSGEKVIFKRLDYLMSDFYLVKNDGSKVMFDELYGFISTGRDFRTVTLTEVPMGTYTAVGMSIGLDSAINHGDPTQYYIGHPLSPMTNSLHWSWQGGYIHTAIEGAMVDGSGSFVFHIAGSNNKVNYEVPINFAKSYDAGMINVDYELSEVFQNPDVFSFQMDGKSTHSTTDPVTLKLVENMSDVFSVE